MWLLAAVILAGPSWSSNAPSSPASEKMQKDEILLEPLRDEPLVPKFPEKDGAVLTIDDCLRTGFEKHPDLMQKKAVVAQMEARLRQVYSLYDPTVALNLSKTYQETPVQSQGFPSSLSYTTRPTQATVNLSQTIYDWDQRKQQLVSARENLEAARLQFLSAWVQTAESIRNAYALAFFLEWVVVIQNDDLIKARNNLNVAQGFYDAGAKAKIDVTQAEFQKSQSEIDLTSSQNDLRDAQAALARTMGVEVEEIVNRNFTRELYQRLPILDRRQAVEEMKKSNPDVLSCAAAARGNMAMARYFEYQKRPSLAGQGYFGSMGDDLPDKRTWNVMLNLSVPIFRDPAVFSKADEQKAMAEQYRRQLDSQVLKYTEQIESALENMDGAGKREVLAESQARTAARNYVLAYQRYKMGVSEIIELNNARDYLNISRKNYVKAFYDRKTAEFSLDKALGRPGVPKPATRK
jgi:outer membrane protein